MYVICEKYTNVCPILYAHTDIARIYIRVRIHCMHSMRYTHMHTHIHIHNFVDISTFQAPPTNGWYIHTLLYQILHQAIDFLDRVYTTFDRGVSTFRYLAVKKLRNWSCGIVLHAPRTITRMSLSHLGVVIYRAKTFYAKKFVCKERESQRDSVVLTRKGK